MLAVVPQLTLFNFRRISANITFGCQQSTSAVEWSEQGGRITLLVTFEEDLEGNNADVKVKLNQSFVSQSSLSITFKMVSSDLKLIVFRSYPKKQILETVFYVISLTVLVLLLLSSFFHKMMGV